jgi:hypothetical protein
MAAGTGTEDNTEKLLKLLHRSETPEFSEPTLVSGTAQQDATGVGTTWYIPIVGGTAGTVKVEIGPVEATAHTIIPATAANAVSGQTLTVKLPAKWWIKVTTTVATVGKAVVST